MSNKEVVAMILAGGQGTRLGALTSKTAKPAVPYGGSYRIIDFPLSNCANSGINTVGVLTQYKPLELNNHIGDGAPWGLDSKDGGVTILSPDKGKCYEGTADAIYKNIEYIDKENPENVLILSGDHIYKMDYKKMLDFHNSKGAEATIAVIDVKYEEAHRFGIMNTNEDLSIHDFEEKPSKPRSTKASMGIYIFNWKTLRRFLIADQNDVFSSNDFGKNIIPKMIYENIKVFAYPFKGYWKDVGTIESLWQANMDLLDSSKKLDLEDKEWKIKSVDSFGESKYIESIFKIHNSIITDESLICGQVDNSILFKGVKIGKNTVVRNSIIMPYAEIGDNVIINNAIIENNAIVESKSIIGKDNEIVVVEANDMVKVRKYDEILSVM